MIRRLNDITETPRGRSVFTRYVKMLSESPVLDHNSEFRGAFLAAANRLGCAHETPVVHVLQRLSKQPKEDQVVYPAAASVSGAVMQQPLRR